MPFPDKAERTKCWNARDEFWKCLDENNEQIDSCVKFRKLYESSCSNQWVKHFDRKRQYEKFKSAMDSKNWKDPLDDK